MNATPSRALPYLLEPAELTPLLGQDDLLIVDLGDRETYHKYHLPGALYLDYNALTLGQPPAPGLLPPLDVLGGTLRALGLTPQKHVIAYDNQGNGRASRLLWTLEAVGHQRASLLNGGLVAWSNEGHPLQSTPNNETPAPTTPSIELNTAVIAEQIDVLASLGRADTVILDARSPDEYFGRKSPSLRKGRIPGAVNLNWLDTIDADNHLRFKHDDVLNEMLATRGVARDQEIIVHCQTHHRSSHSFVMLRHLGFARVRGYAGSWSEWGNDPTLPIE